MYSFPESTGTVCSFEDLFYVAAASRPQELPVLSRIALILGLGFIGFRVYRV